MPKIRTEPGRLEYVVCWGVQDPNMLAFYERYQDEAAHAAHWDTEELKAFQEALMPCLAGEPIMGIVEEVASARKEEWDRP